MNFTKELSGIILNENQGYDPTKTIDLTVPRIANAAEGQLIFQEFYLPGDYTRGRFDTLTPDLTGFQVFVGGFNAPLVSALDYVIDYFDSVNWWRWTGEWTLVTYNAAIGQWSTADNPDDPVISGTSVGINTFGNTWMDIYFDDPIPVEDIQTNLFRFGISSRTRITATDFQVAVPFDGKNVIINNHAQGPFFLEPDVPLAVYISGIPSILTLDSVSDNVFYSQQLGIGQTYYVPPTASIAVTPPSAFYADGVTDVGGSLLYRILAETADSDLDVFSNLVRRVAIRDSADQVDTLNHKGFWTSKPNPSPFGVESLYFDLRDSFGNPQVFDRLFVDPITLDHDLNIYFSDDIDVPNPKTTFEWDSKLWQRVPQGFQIKQKDTLVLPKPIVASYVKLEFSRLQPRFYEAGDFVKPIRYQKYPKWVLDYFLFGLDDAITTNFTASRVNVITNAITLAYDYFLDDLKASPSSPAQLGMTEKIENFTNFLTTKVFDNIDPQTLSQINLNFAPYQTRTGLFSSAASLSVVNQAVSQLIQGGAKVNQNSNQPQVIPPVPVEGGIRTPTIDTVSVSSWNRDDTLRGLAWPQMYFFVTCRHQYRELAATFEQNRAYFVSINRIAFLRDQYTQPYDSDLYVESFNDTKNAERNDFVLSPDNVLVTYTDKSF